MYSNKFWILTILCTLSSKIIVCANSNCQKLDKQKFALLQQTQKINQAGSRGTIFFCKKSTFREKEEKWPWSWVMQKVLVKCGIEKFQICQTLYFFARKYVKVQEIDQNTLCDNLGTSRIVEWTIIVKFLTCLVHKEFNFQ